MSNGNIAHESKLSQLSIQEILGPGGLLSKILPGYKSRPGQVALAEQCYQAILDDEPFVAEGATGIGKSLAYLAALVVSDTRAIISTETKILQNQLRDKDIPTLARALGRPIDVAVIKGRSNYVCELEFQRVEADAAIDRDLFSSQAIASQWKQIHSWVKHEQKLQGFAELDDAPVDIPDDIRRLITTDHDHCLGHKCPQINKCFAERARAQAKTADLIIVNHHLLLLNGLLDGQLLPPVEAIVVDEAHTLEEVASSVFSVRIALPRWTWLQRQFQKLSSPLADTVSELLSDRDTTEAQLLLDRLLDEGSQAIDAAHVSAEILFQQWADALGGRRSMPIPEAPALAPQMRAIRQLLQRILAAATLANIPEEQLIRWQRLKHATDSLTSDLERAFEDSPSDDLVRFVELSGRWAVAQLVPVDVSGVLRHMLWDQEPTILATSATLTTGGTFEFWIDRVGAPVDIRTLALPSPFQFSSQARLYLPRPGKDYEPCYPGRDGYEAYGDRMTSTLIGLIQASKGRALVLFTSTRAMQLLAERVRPSIPWRILVQGELSRPALLREFTNDVHSVLFATKSFWQGVDVAGELLSLLVIDKLPFPSPDDPIFEAQCAMIDWTHKGLSFSKLSLPIATLAIRQGFGRLIRRVSDRGVVALLDGRLQTKGYGSYILRSLPPAPRIYRIEDVVTFFGTGGVR
jgi:ATP-dependent DNA helicase DinG